MKEEKSKAENIIGMIGFISLTVIIIGLLIIIWTQPWIMVAKLVLSGIIGFFVSVIWLKGIESNKARKRANELEEKRNNKKGFERMTFEERIAKFKKEAEGK